MVSSSRMSAVLSRSPHLRLLSSPSSNWSSSPFVPSAFSSDASLSPVVRPPKRYSGHKSISYLDHSKNDRPIKTNQKGATLLNNPVLNKGAAFTREERKTFKLGALLPYEVHTLDQQCQRAYEQLKGRATNLLKFSFLISLKDQNQVLFYNLILRHLKELIPIIYTPTAGDAVQQYSHLFRRPTGLYLSYPNRDSMEEDILGWGKREDIDLVVVTDGEAILGIGDWGVGGIIISTAKASLYTLGGGIDPQRILPVVLDVGTDNHSLYTDDLYLGLKKPRLQGEEYDAFVGKFCDLVAKHYPDALLHFEDFGKGNAQRLLDIYKKKQSVFNDDIQGTGAVVLAALISACKVTKTNIKDQRIVMYGFGGAGLGIATQIRKAMISEGLSEEEANKRFYPVDRNGLLLKDQEEVREDQRPFARDPEEVQGWTRQIAERDELRLYDVVKHAKPTVLIGTSTHARSWTEDIITEMAKHVDRPILFPISNPTNLCECDPHAANEWTKGKALFATGSPFPDIVDEETGKTKAVAQANNALIYPGLGLGTIISKATRLTDDMILAGINALAGLSPALQDPDDSLLPDIAEIRKASCKVATAVAAAAAKENVVGDTAEGGKTTGEHGKKVWTEEEVREAMFDPVYRTLEPID